MRNKAQDEERIRIKENGVKISYTNKIIIIINKYLLSWNIKPAASYSHNTSNVIF